MIGEGRSDLLIAYIGESYDLQNCLGYWMSAVIVHELVLRDYWTDLLHAANAVVPGLDVGTELHGSELFGGEGPYSGIVPQKRIDIVRLGLMTINRYQATVAVSANVPGTSETPSLRDWRLGVLGTLIPQIEQVAYNADEFVVLVCDEEHSTTTKLIEMLHDRKTANGILGTPILETAMFARSVYSPGVWPADLVAFIERRLTLGYGDSGQKLRTLRRLRALYQDNLLQPVIVPGAAALPDSLITDSLT